MFCLYKDKALFFDRIILNITIAILDGAFVKRAGISGAEYLFRLGVPLARISLMLP
jgi:hypothetical protein